ncbi:hypothetical protein EKO04_003554 [Ascochyta lentis]|uniref:Uncharacterized protein n=1 Tax=Ascochyta lentis TaxID=205686 RepID=A0A8H7J6N7_9PLEO|nr:hypothetical protein EKO04_003554 [Ascochyta lentis]
MTKSISEDSQQSDNKPQRLEKGKQPIARDQSSPVTPEVVRTNASLLLQQQLSGENALKAIYSGDCSSTDSRDPPKPSQIPERYPLNVRWSFEGHEESLDVPTNWDPPAVSTSSTHRKAAKVSHQRRVSSEHNRRRTGSARDPDSPSSANEIGVQAGYSTTIANNTSTSTTQVLTDYLKECQRLLPNDSSSLTLLPSNSGNSVTQERLESKRQPEDREEKQPKQSEQPGQANAIGPSDRGCAPAAPELSSDRRW